MRPKDTTVGAQLYECFECGGRVEDTETKRCEQCGGQLRHLGRPRDL